MKSCVRLLVAVLLLATGALAGDTAGPLSLAECFRLAEQNQPDLVAAEALVRTSEARLRERRSGFLPRLDFGLGHTQQTYNYSPVPGSDPRLFNSQYAGESASTSPYYSAGLTFNQMLYDFGRTKASTQRGSAELQAARQNRDRVRQEILLNVRTAYFGVLAAGALVKVRASTVQDQQKHLDQVEAFWKVGRRPKIDVTRQEVTLANAQLDLVQAQSDLKVAKAALATAIGLPIDKAPDLADTLSEERALSALNELMVQAEQWRPDLNVVRAQLTAARADVIAARANTKPNLVLSSFTNFRNLKFPLIYNWGFGESLVQSLLSGGLNRARIDEAQATQTAAEASLNSYLLRVRQEVYTTYADADVAKEKIALAEKAADEAKQNLAFAEGRYSAGVGNIIELTDAELLAASTQAQVVTSRYAYQVSLGRLDVAAGREPTQ